MSFKLHILVGVGRTPHVRALLRSRFNSHCRACSLWSSKGAHCTLISAVFNPARGYVGAGSQTLSCTGAAPWWQEREVPAWVNPAEMLNPKWFGFV